MEEDQVLERDVDQLGYGLAQGVQAERNSKLDSQSSMNTTRF